jgi:hypothetical protein
MTTHLSREASLRNARRIVNNSHEYNDDAIQAACETLIGQGDWIDQKQGQHALASMRFPHVLPQDRAASKGAWLVAAVAIAVVLAIAALSMMGVGR